jgi:hypothetical protein
MKRYHRMWLMLKLAGYIPTGYSNIWSNGKNKVQINFYNNNEIIVNGTK